MPARDAFERLEEPWQVCLEEAWTSWRAGSAGVGAVIIDATGEIVARGRNRMLAPRDEPGVIAGSYVAHAEMNALADLTIGAYEGYALYTTFEPCLMCTGAIMQSRIPTVRYAAADPVFDGMHDWLGTLRFAAERLPERQHLGGPVGSFAHVLHLSWLALWQSEGPIIDAHRSLSPRQLDTALDVVRSGHLAQVARGGGDVVDALAALWDRLNVAQSGEQGASGPG